MESNHKGYQRDLCRQSALKQGVQSKELLLSRDTHGGETENCVTFLVFCVLKSTLTHACYKMMQYAFLIPEHQIATIHTNQIPVEAAHTGTHISCTLQSISLTCLWLPRMSEAEGLFQGSLLTLHGKISALDTYIHVELLISATDRSFYWSVKICMTVLIGIRMWA